MKGIMKKIVVMLAALTLATAGCQSWNESDDSDTVMEPAGAQSHSSDVNQGSSSRNVGQSGTSTNDLNAPSDNGSTNQNELPQNNSPQ
jgi:hypothetical protein